ncbi:MAG: malate dehydrogenase [Deltaproteobacteria bacterium]|nr:malate dehydrogenase [Deltaproteobacteria bacterium]
MARKKVSIVGAGHVGSHAALWLALKEISDVMLIDIVEGMAEGKALDIMEAAPVEGFDVSVRGSSDYGDLAASDLVIITAGLPRKPGMTRSDLIGKNAAIVKSVVEQVVMHCPQALLMVVTNPLDVMVHAAWKISGLPPERIVGMAGALDSARLRAFVAMELGVSVEDVQAMVIGGHGDEMVPLRRYTTVSGIPVERLLSPGKVDAVMERTKKAGGEIVSLLKTGSAFYAPSACVAEMAEAIIRDKKRIIPCAAYCKGRYGLDGVFVGVPVRLGERGVEEIIEIDLDTEERKAFDNSVAAIKKLAAELKF